MNALSFSGPKLAMLLLWLGLAAFTVALVVLIWTRWGQYRPLRKCLVLSLLAHVLLAGYATTVEIVTPGPPLNDVVLQIRAIEGPGGQGIGGEDPLSPGAELAGGILDAPDPLSPPTASPKPAPEKPPEPVPPSPAPMPDRVETAPAAPPAAPPVISAASNPLPGVERDAGPKPGPPAGPREPDEDPPVAVPGPPEPRAPGQGGTSVAADATSSNGGEPRGSAGAVRAASLGSGNVAGGSEQAVPDLYKLRVAPDRLGAVQGRGGSPETEAAVQAALKWLAENQSPDGRWDASEHGSGRETATDGRDRRRAGIEADSAMTGLALLTFLASGQTHNHGPYRENVRRGLEYLLRAQAPDGNLAGKADLFARMYSHAIATFAMSEAYGMTGDDRLRDPVRRAIGYTVAAQDPVGGGWRYQPGDPGDTSQLGWQFMALKSAELAGIPIPERTRQGIIRYLQSVSAGSRGGLASYRPREQVSRTMTAEALVCWQFLGLAREHPACNEAGDFLLGELPSEGRTNVYYWYYATLSMYQLQGEHWRQWNTTLRTTLLATQRKEGPLAGTWDPDAVWGGYGGRIYSTSLSALCLEVYYRFLPLYMQAGR